MAAPPAPVSDKSTGTLAPTLGLLLVTAVWGSTFALIKGVVGRMSVPDFLAVRFVIAAVVMVVMFARPVLRMDRGQLWRALALGVLYGVAQLLQTWGLARISPSVSGFATGMYVVFTPLLGWLLLKERTPPATWIAVAVATIGLGLLALHGFELDAGVLLTLASAALYGLHILGLGRWSRKGEAFGMAAVQMVAIAVVCLLATLPHGPSMPPDASAWGSVLYMALAAGALAMLVQTWAQAHMSSTRAAIVMTLEPVFAAGFAILLGIDALGWRTVVGGGLMLGAMYIVELGPKRSTHQVL
jgi:drug/metabolite transporter (DMT)-like permease